MVKASDFDFVTEPVAQPGPGEVLVKVQYISLDPAMRGWMNEGRSYVPAIEIGEVMRAGGIGTAGKGFSKKDDKANKIIWIVAGSVGLVIVLVLVYVFLNINK